MTRLRKFCTCGFDDDQNEPELWSADWHRHHKDHHLAVYPNIRADVRTVDNLDANIREAEARETMRGEP